MYVNNSKSSTETCVEIMHRTTTTVQVAPAKILQTSVTVTVAVFCVKGKNGIYTSTA